MYEATYDNSLTPSGLKKNERVYRVNTMIPFFLDSIEIIRGKDLFDSTLSPNKSVHLCVEQNYLLSS